MYKDKDKQREAIRKAVAKKRQGITKGITKGITQNKNVIPENTKNVIPSVTPEELGYNALMTHLTDPSKRRKLQVICDALSGSQYGKKITFGYHGANLDEVRQMLDLTAGVV